MREMEEIRYKKEDLLDVIMTRRSVRDFKKGDIDAEDLKRILQAGVMAPSASNKQPWRFHVIRGKTKERFIEVLKGRHTIPPSWRSLIIEGMKTVPVLIAVENPLFSNDTNILSFLSFLGTAASVENMLLAAHALGYGSVWLGFPPLLEAVGEVIEISGRVVALLPIGHPAESQREFVNRARKPLEDVVQFYE